MRRLALFAVTVVLVAAAVVIVLNSGAFSPSRSADPSKGSGSTRETAADDLEAVTASGMPADRLPAGTVVVRPGDAKRIEPPFARADDSTASDGSAIVLAEGSASAGKTGRAEFTVAVPRAALWHAWVRAKWRDSCGNSVHVSAGGSAKYEAVDDVYDVWHWVAAGGHRLAAGPQTLTLGEREDGIAIDQALLTPDADFIPTGPVLAASTGRDLRRFADSFDRSPGHGLGPWTTVSGKWEIAFSFDPNRIPNQYSLQGEAEAPGKEAVALIAGAPWKGCRVAFSICPLRPGKYGAVLERSADGKRQLAVLLDTESAKRPVSVSGGPQGIESNLPSGPFRVGQWHRVVIERWAWFLRVELDGQRCLDWDSAQSQTGSVGMLAASGAASFDDIEIEEIPWLAEDGRERRIPWTVGAGAEWYRKTRSGGLVGRCGTLTSPPLGDLGIREAVYTAVPAGAVRMNSADAGAATAPQRGPQVVAARTLDLNATPPDAVNVQRIGIRFGRAEQPALFHLGPYDFSQATIEDPSDYLDFTAEEYAAIEKSPDADKLRREAKRIPIIGWRGDHCIWIQQALGARWYIQRGELTAYGANAELAYSQEFLSDLEMRLRVRFLRADSAAEIALYGEPGGAVRIRLGNGPKTPPAAAANLIPVAVPAGTDWHDLRIRTEGKTAEVQLDRGAPVQSAITRGDGGEITLKMTGGSAAFDDIEFAVPRTTLYAFDRRETDWWREGGAWTDHAGMACVTSSHWVSLIAPTGEGMLWRKQPVTGDVVVGFDIEENSEWFGWHTHPGHTHYAFDNIRVALSPDGTLGRGYRLEMNSRDHSATVLYRDGKEVAAVRQDGGFPIRYHGGDAPYSPRRNRITLAKRGPLFRMLVNNVEVMRWSDPAPLDVSRIGVGGYETRVNFSHLEVRSPP